MSMHDSVSAAILGLIQGLTEFLPISSTGHLILFENILQFEAPPGRVFEVVVQLGSALAVCCAYFKRLFLPIKNFPTSSTDRRFVYTLALATIPAAAAGFLFHGPIKTFLYTPITVACSLIAGGVFFLWLGRKSLVSSCTTPESVLPSQASLVGFGQAVALIPGVSRSGATIASGVLVGLSRKAATEFSFLLAVPTLLGASLYDLYSMRATLTSADTSIICIGFAVSFFASMLAFRPLVTCIERWGFIPFAWYRIALGITVLFF